MNPTAGGRVLTQAEWLSLALGVVDAAMLKCIEEARKDGRPQHIGPDSSIPSGGCALCSIVWPLHRALMDAGVETHWKFLLEGEP